MFYLYYIENIITEKLYVGKSKNPQHRWTVHKCTAKGGKNLYPKSFSYIHASMKKYGIKNFIFNIFQAFDSEIECYLAEKQWLEYFKFNNIEIYNIAPGGLGAGSGINHPGFGKPRTQEVKDKLSKAHKGKNLGSDNPNFGNKMCIESRKKISEARKNSIRSEETKKKTSNTLLSKTPEERNILKGNLHPKAKLSEKDVIQIKLLLKEGKSFAQIAVLFNVSKSTISEIKQERNWKHIKV